VSGVSTPATFSLTNTAGATAAIAASAGATQSATVGAQFATALLVTVTDSHGNPVSGATVTFSAPASGAGATLSTPATTNASGQTSVTATANAIAGSYSVTASVSGVSTPATFSLTNNPATVNITLATLTTPANPNLLVSGDGGQTYHAAPYTFQANIGSQITIATQSPQTATGTQYLFTGWNDNGAISHTINVPSTNTTYTASFTTQYLLTTAVNLTAGGSISPSPGQVWENAGAQVPVTATPNTPSYSFVNFTGSVNSTAISTATNPYTLTMSGPATITANFVGNPDLTISKTHPGGSSGHFSQGQTDATYTIVVNNQGLAASSGPITVTENIPQGLTLESMSGANGSGWTCGAPNAANVCTSTSSVPVSGQSAPITVTVAVSATAPASVTNVATVGGGGELNTSNDTASDPTTINPITDVSSLVSVSETGFVINRATKTWTATMTVTNTSTTTITGPVQVVLTGLTAGVTMTNNTGLRNGNYYITAAANAIAPGASVSVSIQFTNPNNSSIGFTPVTDSGTF
jgi:hypothetical protein